MKCFLKYQIVNRMSCIYIYIRSIFTFYRVERNAIHYAKLFIDIKLTLKETNKK